jgi:electron transport complex protein RnfG
MNGSVRLVVILAVICILAGSLLAGVYQVTKDPIAAAEMKEKLDALAEVLPEYDNVPLDTTCVVTNKGEIFVFYVARKDGAFVGTAVEATSTRGYGDAMRLMVGISACDVVQSVAILKQTETPGLGTKIEKPKFKDQFSEGSATDCSWSRIKRDGGNIEPITGATVSSKAVCGAVAGAVEAFAKNREQITTTVAPPAKGSEEQ